MAISSVNKEEAAGIDLIRSSGGRENVTLAAKNHGKKHRTSKGND